MSVALPLPAAGALVEWYTGQPELFDQLECDLDVVRAARGFFHTGATTCRNDEAVAQIVAAASLGWSQRRIASVLGHSRGTVHAVLERAVEAGKVVPLKERVLAAAGEAIHADIEIGSEMVTEWRNGSNRADLGEISSFRRATWVGAGILADKDGPRAAEITVNVGPGSVVQVVQDYAAKMSRLTALADSESGGGLQFPQAGGGGVVDVIPEVIPEVIPMASENQTETEPAGSASIRPDLAGRTGTAVPESGSARVGGGGDKIEPEAEMPMEQSGKIL